MKLNKDNQIPLEAAVKYLIRERDGYKQKLAEKQDYSGLSELERAIHRGFLAAGVENVPVGIIKETAKECLSQMKPAEWSEVDRHYLNSVISLVHNTTDGAWGSCIGDRIETWLKSLRPSWKPSEEQMGVLWDALGNLKHDGYKNAEIVESLYEQLKKL